MKFSLQVSGVEDVKRSLNKFNKEAVRELQREVDRTAIGIHRRARRLAPVSAGLLRSGIQFTKGRLSALVWAGAKYSEDVEKGQKPGRWPNMDDLQGWVKRQINPGRKRLKSVTYLVGRKIYRRGTDAQPFFEPSVTYYKQRYFNNVRKILKKL